MRFRIFFSLSLLLAYQLVFGALDPNKQYKMELVLWDKTDLSVATYTWLIEEYEKLHPNVKIKLKYQPHRGYRNWFKTQFIAGTAPDIMQMFPRDFKREGAIEGNLIPLKQFLYKPSPYSKSKRWIDDFYSSALVIDQDEYYGEIWSIPIACVTLRIFYNKNLFRRFGIESIPVSYTHLTLPTN